jgi:hypothetical protein
MSYLERAHDNLCSADQTIAPPEPLASESRMHTGLNEETLMSIETAGGHPAMDYREHVRTYNGFLKGSVALIVIVLAILLFMVVTLV